ncbi:hypothetical protein EDB81DRAFT_860238 [Dactylonectria macrodidyma]|uniref:Uncharacterized protein n=1 Tax=Dactylonectria macrodidyma TaxID=307937 RepID=A0A9P9DZN7_9HYPO|nr:hypothetical protein EDB81DRAFT_860238 [Dactylonectria macrodidyma]
MAAASKSPLLCLPAELRNQVYSDVIFWTTPLPESPEACGLPDYRLRIAENFDPGFATILYPPVNTNSHGLLCVNKQVRSEVSILLRKLKSQDKLVYDFDLIWQIADLVVATPRCFPAPMAHIPTVRADLRFVGDYSLTRFDTLWGWSFTGFLNEFFTSLGPDFMGMSNQQTPRKQVSIGKLVINIVNAPTTPTSFVHQMGPLRPGEKEEDVDGQERALRAIETELNSQLRRCPWHGRQTKKLYENIGTVEAWAGGSFRRKWIMSALLPGLKAWDEQPDARGFVFSRHPPPH